MNEFQAILNEGLNDITRKKKVSDTFSPRVKSYLETLGFGKMNYVTLTENLCDSSRWHVWVHDVYTPYSYFPETDKLAINSELDNKTHKERYHLLLKDVSNVSLCRDSNILACLYLLSVDGSLFEFCHNFVFDEGIDFENLRKNPCVDLLNPQQRIFIDTAESLYQNESTLTVEPKKIIMMDKKNVKQFCNGILIASGENVEELDDSFSTKQIQEVV